MKVIFLDVDGVINTDNLLREHGYTYVCPNRVILLKKIIEATDAKIVLSSDWRRMPESRSLIREALKLQNLEFIDLGGMRRLLTYIERQLFTALVRLLLEYENVVQVLHLKDTLDKHFKNKEFQIFLGLTI